MAEYKIVYAVIARGAHRHWLRIGLAFVNRDGSLNVRLDAMPLSGQLQIRDAPGRDEGGASVADVADVAGVNPASMPAAAPMKKRSRS
jgi:hypothetical protein